jgi:hypothetical protein
MKPQIANPQPSPVFRALAPEGEPWRANPALSPPALMAGIRFSLHTQCATKLVQSSRSVYTEAAMPSRASIDRSRDPNPLTRSVVEGMIGEHLGGKPLDKSVERPKNLAAVALSALGASTGSKARTESLSPRKRKLIAKKAAAARWKTGR